MPGVTMNRTLTNICEIKKYNLGQTRYGQQIIIYKHKIYAGPSENGDEKKKREKQKPKRNAIIKFFALDFRCKRKNKKK